MDTKVLIIGSGGREHALAWKISESPAVSKIFVAPGNAGTNLVSKTKNTAINIKDFQEVTKWCKENDVTFVIIGPEDPLALGIVDHLTDAGISCFGPTAAAAQIEASKEFSKNFLYRHNIPTAKFQTFTDSEQACSFIQNSKFEARVVKVSGLAAGKGVIVASSRLEACEAVKDILVNKRFGAAGEVIVVEELLEGPEVSILAFSDGSNVCLMPPAQDHKRLLDDDQGPNTGGMGAVCPYPGLSEFELEDIKKNIIMKTVHGMASEGKKYVGVLYAGLMLTKEGPKVLEFNCRFGDPETQSILSLMTSDLLTTLQACVKGDLQSFPPTFDTVNTAVGVVVVSGGYPGSYNKLLPITGLDNVNKEKDVMVFHAGTSLSSDERTLTNGGRVVCVVAKHHSIQQATRTATDSAGRISFDGAFYRKDIGAKLFVNSTRNLEGTGLSYRDAGVSIVAGERLVGAIKPFARSTRIPGCDGNLGGFGGAFDLTTAGELNKFIVTSTCGVGLKLKYAQHYNLEYEIGYQLAVNCVNQLLSYGAKPLYFLDYYATSKLNVTRASQVIRGITAACLQAECALIGGETAEMPGMYQDGDYDVAGFAVGSVSSNILLPRWSEIAQNDHVIAITYPGIQGADFTIVENLLAVNSVSFQDLFGDKCASLLQPDKLLSCAILPLINEGKLKAFETTVNGLRSGLEKIVTEGLGVEVDALSWAWTDVVLLLRLMSSLSMDEFVKNSSCCISCVFVTKEADTDHVLTRLTQSLGHCVHVIGKIRHMKEENVQFKNLDKINKDSLSSRLNVSGLVYKPNQIQKLIPNFREIRPSPNPRIRLVSYQDLNLAQPVLVSGSDGVGTKLKIAQALNKHGTIGEDLVAMCVNDVLANGAFPLLFTCYLATGQTEPETLSHILSGVTSGCQHASCPLIEEHISCLPSTYSRGLYDLAGFSVAAADADFMLPKLNSICEGDVAVGLPSSGLHSNGFSLVRKVLEVQGLRFDMPSPFNSSVTLGDELLVPTKIYVNSLMEAMQSGYVKGVAHITGGGLIENIPRTLPKHLGLSLDAQKWDIQPIFGWLQYLGKISTHEMARTFNCGLGMVLIICPKNVEKVVSLIENTGQKTKLVGLVTSIHGSEERVKIANLTNRLQSCWTRPPVVEKNKRRVAVLISGSGTNLQALIDHTNDPSSNSPATIALVISNKPSVFGLTRAQRAGILTEVISHKDYKNRSEFDEALHQRLLYHNIDLVCLAGFMRILTGDFVRKWSGSMLNIHPALLPSFKGHNAQKLAVEAKVAISGCTVHFVAEEVDAGAIITQRSVPVYPNDTVDMLSERIKTVEHLAYPQALDIVASGQLTLTKDGTAQWSW